MKSIKYKLTIAITICSLLSLFIAYIIINITVNTRFNSYLEENQRKRDERIVNVFRDSYVRDGQWTEYSGTILIREAEISNFTVSLLDWDRNTIWAMDPLQMIEEEKSANRETARLPLEEMNEHHHGDAQQCQETEGIGKKKRHGNVTSGKVESTRGDRLRFQSGFEA